MSHHSVSTFIIGVAPYPPDRAKLAREMARLTLVCRCPGHRTELEQANCAAWSINQHQYTGEAPNVAAWALIMVQAGQPVEASAFWASIEDASGPYLLELRRAVATYGVKFFTLTKDTTHANASLPHRNISYVRLRNLPRE